MKRERDALLPFFTLHMSKTCMFLGPGNTVIGEYFLLYINFISVLVTLALCKVCQVTNQGSALWYMVTSC